MSAKVENSPKDQNTMIIPAKAEPNAVMLARKIKMYTSKEPITLMQRIIHFVKGNGWISRGQVAQKLDNHFRTLVIASKTTSNNIIKDALDDIRHALNQLKGIGLSQKTKTEIETTEVAMKALEESMGKKTTTEEPTEPTTTTVAPQPSTTTEKPAEKTAEKPAEQTASTEPSKTASPTRQPGEFDLVTGTRDKLQKALEEKEAKDKAKAQADEPAKKTQSSLSSRLLSTVTNKASGFAVRVFNFLDKYELDLPDSRFM